MTGAKPPGWPRVALCLAGATGFLHRQAVADIIEAVAAGFKALGATVAVTDRQIISGAFNLVVVPSLLDEALTASLPPEVVLYNFEQIDTARDSNPMFHRARQRHVVWDYSIVNIARLRSMAPDARLVHVPVGFMPLLERIAPAPTRDIDLLFYGALTPRRIDILRRLHQAGLAVRASFGIYGDRRDALIARARLVLNIHAALPAILEEARLAYLMANAVPILSEIGPDTLGAGDLLDGIATAPLLELTTEARRLLDSEDALAELGRRGWRVIRQRDQIAILSQALAETVALL